MADIFISYAMKDWERVYEIAEQLEAAGYSVDMERGTADSAESVNARIDAATSVLVVWSKVSINALGLRREVKRARAQRKLVSLLVDECRPPAGFEPRHAENLTGWGGDPTLPAWRRTLLQLEAVITGAIGRDETSLSTPRGVNWDIALITLVQLALICAAIFAGEYWVGWIGLEASLVLSIVAFIFAPFLLAEWLAAPQRKALMARWAFPVKDAVTVSSGRAALAWFEALYGRRGWSFSTLWRGLAPFLVSFAAVAAVLFATRGQGGVLANGLTSPEMLSPLGWVLLVGSGAHLVCRSFGRALLEMSARVGGALMFLLLDILLTLTVMAVIYLGFALVPHVQSEDLLALVTREWLEIQMQAATVWWGGVLNGGALGVQDIGALAAMSALLITPVLMIATQLIAFPLRRLAWSRAAGRVRGVGHIIGVSRAPVAAPGYGLVSIIFLLWFAYLGLQAAL